MMPREVKIQLTMYVITTDEIVKKDTNTIDDLLEAFKISKDMLPFLRRIEVHDRNYIFLKQDSIHSFPEEYSRKNGKAIESFRMDGIKKDIRGTCVIIDKSQGNRCINKIIAEKLEISGDKKEKRMDFFSLIFLSFIIIIRLIFIVGIPILVVYVIGSIINGIFISPISLGYDDLSITSSITREIWQHAFTNVQPVTIMILAFNKRILYFD